MALPKISVPSSTFKVPSTGQELTIRQMVSREEKIILMAKESAEASEIETDDIPKAIRQICNNCILSPQIDVDKDLTTFDLQALFVMLRSISVTNMVNLSYFDQEDEQQYDFQVDLNKVPVKFDEKIKLPYQIKITDSLVMNMKWPNAGIFVDPEYVNAKDPTDFMIRNTIDTVIDSSGAFKFSASPRAEQDEFLASMPIDVRSKAIEFVNKIPSLYHKIEYVNSKQTKRNIELKTLSDFFTL